MSFKWAYHMSVLNAYGADVLRSADNLLYVVKLYTDKIRTIKGEIESNRDIAPDWFQGKSSAGLDFSVPTGTSEEEEVTEMFSLTAKAKVQVKIKDEMEGFDDSADDMMFKVFLESVMTEYKKIKKNSWDTMVKVERQVNNWGRPTD